MDEVLDKFNSGSVRYLLIGGQAMRLIGMPRFSMDWDFFIPPNDQTNISRINDLLKEELDLPLVPLGPKGENFIQTYQTRWGIIQFHLGIPGVRRFDEAERAVIIRRTDRGIPVRCLAGSDLLASKKATARPQDQMDVEFLEELERAGKLT